MAKSPNADEREIRKFDEIARIWWDPEGEMGTLHDINPLRMSFIRDGFDPSSCRVLDVGCGGGILSETLAESGAQVTGIDLSRLSLEVARQHAAGRGLSIDYRLASVEETAQKNAGVFDAVTCLEMLEHVPMPDRVVAACVQALKPGGHLFCSTIDRSLKAFLFAVVAGEYVLHLLPRGSHKYGNLIRPGELKRWAGENGLGFVSLASLMYNPLKRRFTLVPGKEDVNYLVHFIKR